MEQAFQTAFIDESVVSNLAYKPQFISNNYKEGRKVLSTLEEELRHCEQFSISVAFITMGGITPLLQILKELENKKIPGRILTTDYLNFSEPRAIKKLAELQNIELKMYCTRGKKEGFHTKGYIFKKEEIYRIIVGSSNMTLNALTQNREWNTKIISTEQGEYAQQVVEEFEELWSSGNSLDFEQFIEEYTTNYKLAKKQKEIAKKAQIPSIQQYTLKPNKMQVEFIQNLHKILQAGKERALLISATGTGKTYASAFAMREQNSKKTLFLVHREQIAKQALESYKRVFEDTKRFGLLSGNKKDYEADYLFSTMQTMAKKENLERFRRDEFESIIIDEVHRAGAASYQRIMEYFTPKFWLGMTASPERTDDFDIYQLFHHNIAYEIRLQQALEENLLCPFHYFGITDLEIEGKTFDDHSGISNFANLVSNVRVNYVLEKAQYYGFSGERVKGLVFCSRKDEARELSKKFNEKGYHTASLSGDDTQERREEYIERLTSDDCEDKLDYLFTVDIFNEGVDIPEVNQIIMLRPTQSSIVFVQQLGRGLRKAENKEYVVVLDFIGNYMNNFMIPIALSGDRTYNKDTIRKYVSNGSRVIPGSSTIHFDEISKERIYSSIDQMKGIKKLIKESYNNLKNKLGHIPRLMDFYENGEIDPQLILDKYKSYFVFLQGVEKEYQNIKFSEQEKLTLEYLSKIISRGKRPHELEILREIIENEKTDSYTVQELLQKKYQLQVNEESIKMAFEVLRGNFTSNSGEREKYAHLDIVQDDSQGFYVRMMGFYERMRHREFYYQVEDLIELGLKRFEEIYTKKEDWRDEFVLYEKYSRRDVCQLLNWGSDFSSTMYGMKRVKDDVAIFITYHKQNAGEEQEYLNGKPDYADEFVNNQIFMWDSQIGKGPDSSYMRDVVEAPRKHLFIKKSDAEGTDFYYMGQFDIIEVKTDKKKDNNGKLRDISKVKLGMHDAVRADLLEYLQKNERISH